MINHNDVIRARFPFPSIKSGLAKKAHMYIVQDHHYDFLKVQTFKPTMVAKYGVKNMVIEEADISRNPFQATSLIDLDKLFILRLVELADSMKTTVRPNISVDLANKIHDKLTTPKTIKIDAKEFVSLNHAASLVEF
ncbi:hypothetical protein ABNZ43_10735 [Weissella sp. GP1]|uniref:hypothetical protein n=1 Tax=Weissella confusa TaxID=1583 RepID=UPI0022E6F164|nr:hypothetical protein [Weissella confusa]